MRKLVLSKVRIGFLFKRSARNRNFLFDCDGHDSTYLMNRDSVTQCDRGNLSDDPQQMTLEGQNAIFASATLYLSASCEGVFVTS